MKMLDLDVNSMYGGSFVSQLEKHTVISINTDMDGETLYISFFRNDELLGMLKGEPMGIAFNDSPKGYTFHQRDGNYYIRYKSDITVIKFDRVSQLVIPYAIAPARLLWMELQEMGFEVM